MAYRSALACCHNAWHPLPQWVEVLAAACDETSLRQAARLLDVSPALVSLTLANKQRSTALIESRVKSRLLTPLCDCPAFGLITHELCQAEQAKPLNTANPSSVARFRACRGGCLHFANK